MVRAPRGKSASTEIKPSAITKRATSTSVKVIPERRCMVGSPVRSGQSHARGTRIESIGIVTGGPLIRGIDGVGSDKAGAEMHRDQGRRSQGRIADGVVAHVKDNA